MVKEIGLMRDRVTIQYASEVSDGGGGAALTWVDVATVWAEVSALSDGSKARAYQAGMTVSHRVTIRYRPDLDFMGTKRYRLMHQGIELHVSSLRNPDGVKRFIEFSCLSGQMVAS